MPKKVIDLTATVDLDSQQIEKIEYKAKHFAVHMANVTLFNHTGTHFDPPSHLIPQGKSVDEIPLEKCIGPGRLFDLRSTSRTGALEKKDFMTQQIQPGEVVLALVGNGMASPIPYLSGEAAEYLASIPIKAFATDAWTIASQKTVDLLLSDEVGNLTGDLKEYSPEHYAFLSKEIPNFEGLTNLEALLHESSFAFVGFPLKLEKGSGAPARAAALIY